MREIQRAGDGRGETLGETGEMETEQGYLDSRIIESLS